MTGLNNFIQAHDYLYK